MFLRYARWVTDKYILAMLGLFPLYVGFRVHAYTAVTEAKMHFFAWATAAWLAAVVVLLIVGAVRGERYPVAVRPAHIGMAVFILLSAVSALVSEFGSVCLFGSDRYNGLLTTAGYAAVFFGVSLLAEPRPRYVWAIGASSAVCCVVALLQLLGLDPFRLYPEGMIYYDKFDRLNGAFLGTIGNTGVMAAFLCAAAPLTAVYGALSERRRDRFLLIPAALSAAVLLLCDVDAGVLALVGCALVTTPVVLRSRRARRVAAGVSGGLAVTGLAGLFFWPGTSGTLYEIGRVLHGELSDEFGSHRGQIWKQGWRLFLEKPWLGGGPGTAGERFDITWSRYIGSLEQERVVAVTNAHNVYLEYLMDMGVFALAGYLAAAVCSAVTWLRRREDALYAALGASMLCFMIQDFFALGLLLSEPFLFIVWGLLESADE